MALFLFITLLCDLNATMVCIPVKNAIQTPGKRTPKPFNEATLTELSDEGTLFLAYFISFRQISLLLS